MAALANLFDAPILPGLGYRDDIITEAEERALIAQINGAELSPFSSSSGPASGSRLAMAGYDFETGGFAPADPVPDWLAPLKARAARFAGLDAADLVQALLIRYDPGAGIDWHRDRPVFEHVIGISLGEPATMRFRRRAAPGSSGRPRPRRPGRCHAPL